MVNTAGTEVVLTMWLQVDKRRPRRVHCAICSTRRVRRGPAGTVLPSRAPETVARADEADVHDDGDLIRCRFGDAGAGPIDAPFVCVRCMDAVTSGARAAPTENHSWPDRAHWLAWREHWRERYRPMSRREARALLLRYQQAEERGQ